jgi:hypothetical protein
MRCQAQWETLQLHRISSIFKGGFAPGTAPAGRGIGGFLFCGSRNVNGRERKQRHAVPSNLAESMHGVSC